MNKNEKDLFEQRVNDPKQKIDKSWERYFDPGHKVYTKIRNRFLWIRQQLIGPVILDVGCSGGIGCYVALHTTGVTEVHGIDLQRSVLCQARKNVQDRRVQFHVGFAEDLPFINNHFDTVMLTETLEHVYDCRQAISEAHRVLKPNGRVVITVPSYRGNLSREHLRAFNEDILRLLIDPYFVMKRVGLLGTYLIYVGEKNE